MKITVGIPTRERYDTLSHTLLSLALQTKKPHEVIVVDDSPNPVDIRNIPIYEYILKLFDTYGIKWRVVFGQKKGQHYSHQMIQEIAEANQIFRIDDDCVAEPNVLELLSSQLGTGRAAVAPAVMMPNPAHLPAGLLNKISDMNSPNAQWFMGTGTNYAEHLYSCFLYRKGIAKYDLNLSTVAHREETIFSHSLFRAGYKLLVNSDARVWHFRQPKGGIRSGQAAENWENDEKIFQGYLNLWGVSQTQEKVIVLDAGLGDHYAFKNIIPELKGNLKIACCYPEVFYDEKDLKLISIAEAKLLYGNIDQYNIYKFMIDHNWQGSLVDAFRALYL